MNLVNKSLSCNEKNSLQHAIYNDSVTNPTPQNSKKRQILAKSLYEPLFEAQTSLKTMASPMKQEHATSRMSSLL